MLFYFYKTVIETLKNIDTSVFLFLNGKHNAFFDTAMFWVSHKFFWIPFYALLLTLIIKNFGWKSLLFIIPTIVFIITASDQISVHLFKNIFQRYRPCHNLQIQHLVHTISGCGGQYGFVSTHASNVFALTLFVGFLLKQKVRFVFLILFLWASLVSYSRIYNGVHYPADIAVGALLGGLIGWCGFKIYLKIIT